MKQLLFIMSFVLFIEPALYNNYFGNLNQF